VVYIDSAVFHCSTLGQQPAYYVTRDLVPVLRGLGVDEARSQATYSGGVLTVIVPVVGSAEQIEEVRKWKDPEEMKAHQLNKAAAKREREEEVAQQQLAERQQQNKKKKSGKKNAAKKKAATAAVVDAGLASKRTPEEGKTADRIAAEIGQLSEQKASEAVKKSQAKEQWLGEQEQKAQQKRRKKKGASDDLREEAKAQVLEKFSQDGKRKAQKEKKTAKKQQQVQQKQKAAKGKKSVQFSK
jgi:IgA-specific serine endopeptidase